MSNTLLGIRGIENTSMAFRKKLIDSARELGMEPDHLATIISFESAGSFSPSKRNPLSGCVGLIQFCRPAAVAAAADAGLTMTGDAALDWLSKMTPEQQLDHVVGYFKRMARGHKPLTLEQAYLLVFAPAFAFRELNAVAYAAGTKAYDQNKGMDSDGDGKITVADVAGKIAAHFQSAANKARVAVEDASSGSLGRIVGPTMALFVGGTAGYLIATKYL